MGSYTIETLRTLIKLNCERFYRQRGTDLPAWAENLQKLATGLRAAGKSQTAVRRTLTAAQADILRWPNDFQPAVKKDILVQPPTPASPRKMEKSLAAQRALFRGKVGILSLYAGNGDRLGCTKPKFEMNPQDLLDGLEREVSQIAPASSCPIRQTIIKQLQELGGLHKVAERFNRLQNWSLGERIFIARTYRLYQDAKSSGLSPEDIKDVLQAQKLKIILNRENGGQVIESFIKNKFFGLDPKNFLFMYQVQHPSFEVMADGSLRPDAKHPAQGNHGLTHFNTMLDNVWFRVIPDNGGGYREEALPQTDVYEFQAALSIMMGLNVEDLQQLSEPYDYGLLGYALVASRKRDIAQVMQIVEQKSGNPQTGSFFGEIAGESAVMESTRLPDISPANVDLINRNLIVMVQPNQFEQTVLKTTMMADLHPTFSPRGPEMLIRIVPEIPFGETNLHLSTDYRFMPGQKINNLKDPADIIRALLAFEEMEKDEELIKFAVDFLAMK